EGTSAHPGEVRSWWGEPWRPPGRWTQRPAAEPPNGRSSRPSCTRLYTNTAPYPPRPGSRYPRPPGGRRAPTHATRVHEERRGRRDRPPSGRDHCAVDTRNPPAPPVHRPGGRPPSSRRRGTGTATG